MGKKKRHDYWKGFPDDLKFMLLAHARGFGSYCIRPVILWLKDHLEYCDSFMYDTNIYDVLRWIFEAFDMCLFPLEQAEKEWDAYKEDISLILERADELLKRIAPKDIEYGFRTQYDHNRYFNMVGSSQKLNIYFSVLYMYTGETEKLKKRLDLVIQDSIRNVKEMLNAENAMQLACMEDSSHGFHFPGGDAYETINWLTKEFLPNYEARKALADCYGAYLLFLKEYKPVKNQEALDHLQCIAEKNLLHLCDFVLEEIDDLIEYMGEPEDKYKEEIERYESILKALEYGDLKDVIKPLEIKYDYIDLPF